MNKTIITAIASIIAFILLVINTFAGTNFQVNEDVLISVATLIFAGAMWFISHYWNQDYSNVAKKVTPIMRKIKKLEKEGDLTLFDQMLQLVEEWEADRDDD